MITVLIKSESHYTVDRTRIRETIQKFLKERGVKGKVEISLSVAGDRLMRKLNSQYRHLDETAVVLAFPFAEDKTAIPFISSPDDILRLGDIIISYPQARNLADEENKLVDDKIDELVIHGMKHLLGNNQD